MRSKILTVLFIALAGGIACLWWKRNDIAWLRQLKMKFGDQRSAWITETKELPGIPGYSARKYEYDILSPVYHIDTVYKSMMGPSGVFFTGIENDRPSHLLWLTDYAVDVWDKTGSEPMSKDFMCHNNLDFSVPEYLHHFKLDNRAEYTNSRFATLTEGQAEIHFPKGFGIPLFSDDKVTIGTQVLNHNIPKPDIDVRHRIRMGYVRESEVQKPLVPLFKQTVHIVVPLDESGAQKDNCTPQQDCRPVMASLSRMKMLINGKNYTGHWIIKEGPDTIRMDVTDMLQLPFNTTLHYASVHLHAYSLSLALRDITTGTTVFTSRVENYKGRTGMEKIDDFSSEAGVPLYKNHRYELVCITNNDSGRQQDMMAVMLLYMRDKELEKNIAELRNTRLISRL